MLPVSISWAGHGGCTIRRPNRVPSSLRALSIACRARPGRSAPHKLPEEELDRVFNINLKGPFFCTKYAVPYISKSGGGSIVNVCSVYGVIGGDTPAYDASKGALRSMSKSDAVVLRKHNIRVNSIHPGNVWSPLFEEIERKLGGIPEETDKIVSERMPIPRMAKPHEIAWPILFLSSSSVIRSMR